MSAAVPRAKPFQATPAPALRGFEGTSRYWDGVEGAWIAPVVAGDYYVTAADEVIATVLGSCVSVCVRDATAGVGGMNHFMLPDDPRGDTAGAAMRFGSYAVERLINELVKYGARRERLEIKVFGGGCMVRSRSNVGEANVRFVRHYLQEEGLVIAAEDVGGPWARRLRYHSRSGVAWIKHLDVGETRRLEAEEDELRSNLRQRPLASGEVELF